MPRLTAVVGSVAVLCGCWWLWGTLLEPFRHVSRGGNEPPDFLFLAITMPLMALPGIFLAYFGYHLTRSNEARNVKRVTGCSAVFAVVFLSYWIEKIIPSPPLPDDLKSSVGLLLATLVTIPIYAKATSFLICREGSPAAEWKTFITRNVVLVVAFEFYWLARSIFDAYAPIEPGYKYVHQEPWGMIGLFAPFFIGWLFYKLAMHRIQAEAPSPMVPPPSPLQSHT